jgi:hypothetical protein
MRGWQEVLEKEEGNNKAQRQVVRHENKQGAMVNNKVWRATRCDNEQQDKATRCDNK